MEAKGRKIGGRFEIRVPVGVESVDQNGHVNNVEYIRWMQEAAAQHSDAVGCTAATVARGATWVVRAHHIEYVLPTFEGETLIVRTWISNAHRVRSKRSYQFVGAEDDRVRANAWTEWVFLDVKTGRPLPIPADIMDLFGIVADEPEV